MKMASGLFWGIFLIFFGLSMVIRIVFNVDIPVFKLLVAFFFVWLGLRIMLGDRGFMHFRTTRNDVIFNENSFKEFNDENKDFNVIFGKAVYDFRDMVIKENTKIHLGVVFGGAEIKLKLGTSYRIVTESVFGGIKMPNGNTSVFGSSHYQSENYNADLPYLFIKTEVVFGGVEVREYL